MSGSSSMTSLCLTPSGVFEGPLQTYAPSEYLAQHHRTCDAQYNAKSLQNYDDGLAKFGFEIGPNPFGLLSGYAFDEASSYVNGSDGSSLIVPNTPVPIFNIEDYAQDNTLSL
jgi:hypothetical protein